MSNSTRTQVREPFMHITKRTDVKLWQSWGARIIAIILALVVNGFFIDSVTGLNPVDVYKIMWTGTFESTYNFMTTLRDVAMLLCISLALAPAFKMRFWNIGAEGQVLMGALLSAVVMIYLGGKIPSSSLFIIMFIVSCAAGALWAAIPAYFRAKWKTNETLFTLMMNYVAIDIVDVCTNTWRGSKSSMGQINAHTKAGWFPKVLDYRFTISILIVLALAIIIELYLNHSKHGYELSVLGESEDTARYAGINVQKVIVRTMLMSGAICGIAGFITVAGTDMTVSSATARGFGFTAIIVTWLAGLKTPYMFGMSFLLIFLEKGASQISSAYSSLNDYSTQVITGIILFFILGSEFFVKYKLVRRKKETAKKGGDSK